MAAATTKKRQVVPSAAVPETTSDTNGKKSRARRLRFVLTVGAKIDGGKAVPLFGRYELPEEIWSNKEKIKSFAEESFQKQFGCAPSTIDAGKNDVGYYDVQGTGQSKANDLTITVPRRNVKYTNNEFRGILQGYKVDLLGIKGMKVDGKEYKDNELVEATFRARHEMGAERPRLNPGPVSRALWRISDVQNVEADEFWPDDIKDIAAP